MEKNVELRDLVHLPSLQNFSVVINNHKFIMERLSLQCILGQEIVNTFYQENKNPFQKFNFYRQITECKTFLIIL